MTYGLGNFGTGYLAGEGGGYRQWQPPGHQGWWGASLLAPAPAPGGIHQVHVNTSHGQLNHLSVSGLQSQRERPLREEGGGRYRTPSGGNDLSPVQVGSAGASLGGQGKTGHRGAGGERREGWRPYAGISDFSLVSQNNLELALSRSPFQR